MKAFFKTILYVPLFNLLIFLVWLMPGNSLALAIILLTIIIRIIFLPSLLKQGVSQEKLKFLQPKLKELQLKHKDDKAAQSKAMIDLYKEAGTSPWGACLPLIVQMIVLVILYRVFQVGLNTSRFDLLYSFVPHPESINTNMFGINLSKPDLWILPILAAAAQFFQTKLAMPNKPTKAEKDNPMAMATTQMLYIFPIMTIVIARNLPSALALYWTVTSIFMIGQQLYINRVLKPKVHEQLKHLKVEEILDDKKIEDKPKAIATPGKGVAVTIRRKK